MIGFFIWPFPSPSQCEFERAVLNSVSLAVIRSSSSLGHFLNTLICPSDNLHFILSVLSALWNDSAGVPKPSLSDVSLQHLGQCVMSPDLYPVFTSTHKYIFHKEMFVNYQRHPVVSDFFWDIPSSLCIWSAGHLHLHVTLRVNPSLQRLGRNRVLFLFSAMKPESRVLAGKVGATEYLCINFKEFT